MKKALIHNLLMEMANRGITIYKLSRQTGIKYELLRRVFRGGRKLTAEELVLICDKTNIKMDDLK